MEDVAQGLHTPAVYVLGDHPQEKHGCHACQNPHGLVFCEHGLGKTFRFEMASLQDYVDHITETSCVLYGSGRCKPAVALEAGNAANV